MSRSRSGACPVCLVVDESAPGRVLVRLDEHPADGRVLYTTVRCRRCGHEVLSEAPRWDVAYLEEYMTHSPAGARYATGLDLGGPPSRLRSLLRASPLERVLALKPPPAAVLDVGCGNGETLQALVRRGYDAQGFEVDEVAARVVRARGLSVTLAGDLAGVAYPAEAFDIIFLNHVLEHTSDPRSLLHEIRRLLRPGGILFLAVPNASCAQARIFAGAWVAHEVPRHRQFFSHRSLVHIVQDEGFRCLRFYPRAYQSPRAFLTNISGLLRHRRHVPVAAARAAAAFLVYPISLVTGVLLGRGFGSALALPVAGNLVYLFTPVAVLDPERAPAEPPSGSRASGHGRPSA